MPTNPSAEIESSCKRGIAHVKECGRKTSVTETDCNRFALTERPERSQNYDCVAQLPCDATDASSCDPTRSEFGDQLCGSVEERCAGTCDAKTRTALNIEGAWLRADVMAAASSCTTHSECGDVKACLSAWFTAVVR
jgi:hypothetical protein